MPSCGEGQINCFPLFKGRWTPSSLCPEPSLLCAQALIKHASLTYLPLCAAGATSNHSAFCTGPFQDPQSLLNPAELPVATFGNLTHVLVAFTEQD